MHICRNIRCNKVVDYEGEKIQLKGLCRDCEILALNDFDYTKVYCEGCGEVFIIRRKLIGDRANELGICPQCSLEIKKREKESY